MGDYFNTGDIAVWVYDWQDDALTENQEFYQDEMDEYIQDQLDEFLSNGIDLSGGDEESEESDELAIEESEGEEE